MATFTVEYLGCKVNQYEAEALREGLEALGLVWTPGVAEADLYILNTCSVTGHAGATSRKSIRRALRANPQARVLVTGCYAVSDRERVAAMEGVEHVFTNDEKREIPRWVASHVLDLPDPGEASPLRVTRMSGQTRAFLKVQDGCNDRCTFCIIPRLRGPARSRGRAEVVAEARRLVAAGHREIVLTGVHLGYFGVESGRPRRELLALLRELAEIPGLLRLKLSSIEVHEITPELVDLLAGNPVFSPHLHLPLQSGSDRILARMRRRYNTRLFLERVELLRERLDRPALSTDVIVGFPGEGADDFERTLEMVERARFMKTHVFPYSRREGTEAATMEGHLPPDVIQARRDALLALDGRLGAEYRMGFLGEEVPVLIERRGEEGGGWLTGLTDRYVRVRLRGPLSLQGEIVPVRLEDALPDGAMVGTPAGDPCAAGEPA